MVQKSRKAGRGAVTHRGKVIAWIISAEDVSALLQVVEVLRDHRAFTGIFVALTGHPTISMTAEEFKEIVTKLRLVDPAIFDGRMSLATRY